MTATTPKIPTWVTALLGLSLALNLFFIGLIGGQALSGAEEAEAPPRHATRGYSLHPRVMLRVLPEERHEDVRAFYSEARKSMRGEWRAINELRMKVDAALRAEPFDAAAMEQAQKQVVQARADLRNRANARIEAFIATLPENERLMLADAAMESLNAQRDYWRKRREKREKEGEQ